jgi:DNA primase
LIFPIEDIGGNVVAFGGRIIGEREPKYLNSPESPVYVKGRCLYGLNRTKDDIRQKGFAIIVEGYFDLLSLWNAGVANVVATLGTALTKDHVDLIRRYTGHVIVVFDPDEAGKKALERSLSLFLAGNINAKVVVLPDEHDPDQYVRTFGKEAFDELVAHAQSMVDYYIEKVIGKVGTLEDKMASVRNAVPFIVNIGDAIERNLFIKRISEKLGIDEGLLKKEVHRSSTAPSAVSAEGRGMEEKGKIDRIELSLINIMLEYPRKIPEMVREEILNYLTNADLKKFLEDIKDAFDKHDDVAFDATLLVNHMNNDTIRQKLLKKMMDEAPYDEQMADCVLSDAIRQIKKKWYREKHRILKMKLVKAEERADQELCNSLLSEKEKLLREEALSS